MAPSRLIQASGHGSNLDGNTDARARRPKTGSPGVCRRCLSLIADRLEPAFQSLTARSLKALPITLTEDRDIASAAIAGDSSRPKVGYRRPAATGIPRAL